MRYLITFSTYGSHLHGNESGSVDRRHNLSKGPLATPDPTRFNIERQHMSSMPCLLNQASRALVLQAIHEVCHHRAWNLLAAQVRSTHVHTVVEAECAPEKVMTDFKAYATRKLNQRDITEAHIRELVNYKDLIPTLKQALKAFSAGQVTQPLRTILSIPNHTDWFAVMPAVYGNIMGAKMVSFYPKNAALGIHTHLAVIQLFRADTGEPLATMDGRLITEMRTAATSALAVDLLAPPDTKVLAILGSGIQARSHFTALAHVRSFTDVRVWSKTPEHAAACARELQATSVATAEQAVKNADVILTLTSSPEPILQGKWLKPDSLVCAVGAVSLDRRELDDEVIRGAVIVESRAAALKEPGDLLLAHAEITAELGELLNGASFTRKPVPLIFKSVGIAIENIAAAKLVYDKHVSGLQFQHLSKVRLLVTCLFLAGIIAAEPVTVRYVEGSVHGFLSLSTLDGELLASGDLTQIVHNSRVVSHLTFHFKDGSLDDETAIFSERGVFKLISDHHIQRGPMFPKPLDLLINVATGMVTVRHKDKGENKVETEHMDLPPDLANGVILNLLKNIPTNTETRLFFVAATPKPRLVKLVISAPSTDTFSVAGSPRKSTRFQIKIDIGGVAGAIAPIIGKQPENINVWISGGDVPAFVKSEGFQFVGGPLWRIQMTTPVWPRQPQ